VILAANPSIDAGHVYTDTDGARIISCTQALQLAGIIDYSAVPQEYLMRACERGTLVHKITALIDQHWPAWPAIDVPDTVRGYVESWIMFRQTTGFRPQMIERSFIAQVNGMRFGMTLDREGSVVVESRVGEPLILELKTAARGREPWWGVQLAGYDLGLGPIVHPPYTRRRAVVQLDQDGRMPKLRYYEDPADAIMFRCALAAAHWRMRNYRIDLDAL
jgi:hypothetical protein